MLNYNLFLPQNRDNICTLNFLIECTVTEKIMIEWIYEIGVKTTLLSTIFSAYF